MGRCLYPAKCDVTPYKIFLERFFELVKSPGMRSVLGWIIKLFGERDYSFFPREEILHESRVIQCDGLTSLLEDSSVDDRLHTDNFYTALGQMRMKGEMSKKEEERVREMAVEQERQMLQHDHGNFYANATPEQLQMTDNERGRVECLSEREGVNMRARDVDGNMQLDATSSSFPLGVGRERRLLPLRHSNDERDAHSDCNENSEMEDEEEMNVDGEHRMEHIPMQQTAIYFAVHPGEHMNAGDNAIAQREILTGQSVEELEVIGEEVDESPLDPFVIAQEDTVYACSDCGFRSVSQKDVEIHLNEHTNESAHRDLSDSSSEVSTSSNLIQAQRVRNGPVLYKTYWDAIQQRVRHDSFDERGVNISGNNRKMKEVKQAATGWVESFVIDLKKNAVGHRYKCSLCPRFTSKARRDVETHLISSHSDMKPYMCGRCGVRDKTQRNAYTHFQRCIGYKPYKCEKCDQPAYADSKTLRNHVLKKHPDVRQSQALDQEAGRVGRRLFDRESSSGHMEYEENGYEYDGTEVE